MNSLLDLVQSTVFAGVVLLLLVRLNATVSDVHTNQTYEVSTQENAAVSTSIIENDFRKMGYGAGSSPITAADTLGNISFKAVIDSTGGMVKTIQYQVGAGSSGHKKLTRTVNPGTSAVIHDGIDSLNVTYYDKTGSRMPGSALVLGNIGSMKIRMIMSNTTKLIQYDTTGYRPATIFWEKRITPKSLQSSL